MPALKPQWQILIAELSTIDSDKGPIPWRFAEFADTMKFPADRYPSHGVTKLPMDCPDFKGIADTSQSYMKLQAFFWAFDKVKYDDDKVRLITNIRDTSGGKKTQSPNEFRPGAELFDKYWKHIANRAKFSQTVDDILRKVECMPWQAAEALDFPWPPPPRVKAKKVWFSASSAFSSSVTVYRPRMIKTRRASMLEQPAITISRSVSSYLVRTVS